MNKHRAGIDLSIVIPAYREEKRIGKTLDALARYLESDELLASKRVEVIIVAADAPDKTLAIVNAKRSSFRDFTVITPGPKMGKGRDVQAGMLHARGAFVVFMDADLATPLGHITEFYRFGEQGIEVIVGVRDLERYRHNLSRVIVSAAGNVLYRIAGGVWIKDSQCGFKMFSARAAHLCFTHLTIMGWGFDMEVLAAAKANGFFIKKVRILDYIDMPFSTFQDNVLGNSFSALVDLAHIFVHRVSGYYRQRAGTKGGA